MWRKRTEIRGAELHDDTGGARLKLSAWLVVGAVVSVPLWIARPGATTGATDEQPPAWRDDGPIERALREYARTVYLWKNYEIGDIKTTKTTSPGLYSFELCYTLREAEYEPVEAAEALAHLDGATDISVREASEVQRYARTIRKKGSTGLIRGECKRHGEMANRPLYLVTDWSDEPADNQEKGKVLRLINQNSLNPALDIEAPEFSATLRRLVDERRNKEAAYDAVFSRKDAIRQAAHHALNGPAHLKSELPSSDLHMEIVRPIDPDRTLIRFYRSGAPNEAVVLRAALDYDRHDASPACVFSLSPMPGHDTENWFGEFHPKLMMPDRAAPKSRLSAEPPSG